MLPKNQPVGNTADSVCSFIKGRTSVLGAVSPDGGDTREEEEKVVPRNALQMWTDDDLATLAKYIKKFPGGTVDR